jgi:hypothetical protein
LVSCTDWEVRKGGRKEEGGGRRERRERGEEGEEKE